MCSECVCVLIYTHVCVCVLIYTHMCARWNACWIMWMFIISCVGACAAGGGARATANRVDFNVSLCECMCSKCECVCVCVCVYVCVCVCVSDCVYAAVYTRVCVFTCVRESCGRWCFFCDCVCSEGVCVGHGESYGHYSQPVRVQEQRVCAYITAYTRVCTLTCVRESCGP